MNEISAFTHRGRVLILAPVNISYRRAASPIANQQAPDLTEHYREKYD